MPFENIIICATHTHTGPVVTNDYEQYLVKKITESSQDAYSDVFEGKLSSYMSHIEGIYFNRRYFMKDGSVVTNSGKCNPDIVRSAGPAPTEIQFVRIDRVDKNECAVLINFAIHPDTISGNLLSADYPYFIEKEICEKLRNISYVIFTNGTGGDVNHWNVSDLSLQRGFEEKERIGRAIGAKIVSEFDKVQPVSGERIKVDRERVSLPYINVSKEEINWAKMVLEKPYPDGVDFTMEVIEAKKIIKASELTDEFNEIGIVAIAIGDTVLVGMPAEMFFELGTKIKRLSPFRNTVIIDLSFDCIGYTVTEKVYREGGYEVASNVYKPETGKIIIEGVLRLLDRMYRR